MPEMKLYRKQVQFLDATEPIRGFVAGQGAGKSKVGAYDLLKRIKPGRLYTATAPTYPMLRDATFRSFREVAELTGQWRGVLKTEFTAIARTRYGGEAEILFRSAGDPDHLRGPNLSGAWMDEASLCQRESFQILTARLREGGEAGWLSATFTPKGLSHWTYEVFGKGGPGVSLTRASTKENPFLHPSFIETVYQQFSGLRAAQELGGAFCEVEGAEWPAEFFDDHIWFTDWPDDLILRVLSLDPSKGRTDKPGDYSAFVDLGLDARGCLWVDADLAQGRPVTRNSYDPGHSIVGDGLDLWAESRPSAFVVEVNGFQELIISELIRQAQERELYALPQTLYGITNTLPKPTRIRMIGPYLARTELRIRDTPGGHLLIAQLRDFPCGEHDDGPDALEMGIRTARHLLGEKLIGAPELLTV